MRYARPLVFAAFASLSAAGSLHCGGGAQTSIADGPDGGDASTNPTDASTNPTDAPPGPTDGGPTDVLQFGYFGNADAQIEVDLRGWQNVLDELHGRGNVVLMNYLSEEDLENLRKSGIKVAANVNADDLLVAKMRAARGRGFGSVLVLASVFFEGGKLAQLRPDYKARWAHLKDVLTRNNLLDDVVAEYTLDEPYHNAKAQGVSAATMKTHLETINAFLATELPGAKRLLVESYSAIGTDYQPPAGYAFIGLNCYGSFTRCGPEGVSIPSYIARLKARATGGEKIALIPDAFVFETEKMPIRTTGNGSPIPRRNTLTTRTHKRRRSARLFRFSLTCLTNPVPIQKASLPQTEWRRSRRSTIVISRARTSNSVESWCLSTSISTFNTRRKTARWSSDRRRWRATVS